MATIAITVELKDSELGGALAELMQVLERRGAKTSAGNSMGNTQAVSPAEYAAKGGAASPQAVSPAATGMPPAVGTGKNGTAGAVSAAENGAGSPQAVSPAATGMQPAAGTGKNGANEAVSPAEYAPKGGAGSAQAVSPAAAGMPPMLTMPSAPHGTGSGPLVWSLPGSAADPQAARRKGSAEAADTPAAGAERARITFDDIARAAWSLVEAGRGVPFHDLLRRFGIQALTQLPRERFEPFAEALRQLGVTV